MRKILVIAGAVAAMSMALSLAAEAENLAVIWTGCTSAATTATCTGAVKYDIPTASDSVALSTNAAAVVPFSSVPPASTIRACTTANVARGAVVPTPWTQASDPCKDIGNLPASTWATPAQIVQASAAISWVAPTQDSTGAPLTGASALTGYQVFVSLSPIPDDASVPAITVDGSTVAKAYVLPAPVGATIYARVRAVNKDGISVMSGQASKVVPAPVVIKHVPGAPTVVTISLAIPIVP